MPWALILVVGGLALVFATSYVTLGWILVAIGAALFLLTFLIFAFAAKHVRKQIKDFDRKFDGFYKL